MWLSKVYSVGGAGTKWNRTYRGPFYFVNIFDLNDEFDRDWYKNEETIISVTGSSAEGYK